MNPKVSVCVITYNHEKFIVQTIDGVLMQKTNFDFEFIIGEDCSSDKTREIIVGFQKKYPGKITLLAREKNLGMMNNFIDTIQICQGEYIAFCEGDDYWTDPLKLQKQVDFLEANLDYSISGHNVKVAFEGFDKQSEWDRAWSKKEWIGIEDVIISGGAATGSLVWRNNVFGNFPDWFVKQHGGDWSLQILCASKGKMKYFNEIMGVYRIHDKGAYGTALEIVKKKNLRIEEFLYNNMQSMINALDLHFAHKYSSLFDMVRNYSNLEAFGRYALAGDFINSKKYAQKVKLVLHKFPPKIIIIFIVKIFIIRILPKKIAMYILHMNMCNGAII